MLHPPENRQLIARVASDETLDIAFDWVCKRRKGYSHNSDIWALRRGWPEIKPNLQQILLAGEYEFDALREIRTGTEVIDLWSSQDALVLKALAYVLGEHLDPVISASCHYVKCRGGAKSAVRKVMSGERVIARSASPVIARNVMTKQSHA